MKLLGVVVLYYPDEDLKDNILSYLPYLDELIIWENTPVEDRKDVQIRKSECSTKITCLSLGRNVGIGKALNEAVNYGIRNGYSHILTMDQDSRFPDFDSYKQEVMKLEDDNSVAAFSVSFYEVMTFLPEKYIEVETCITSGSIHPLQIFQKTGTFRDDFFIDAIDTEFSFRVRRKGYKLIRYNQILMEHRLGENIVTPFLWGRLETPNYSAHRTYYLVRNTLLLIKMYPEYKQPFTHFKNIFYWRTLNIIFVEKDKLAKFRAMVKGIYHACIKKTGE